MSTPPTPPGGSPPPDNDPKLDFKNVDMSVQEGGPAWEGEGNVVQRFVSTVIQMVVRPMPTFEPEGPPLPEGHVQPLIFALLATLPFAIVGAFLSGLLHGSISLGLLIIMPVMQVVGLYLGALLGFVGLLVLKVNRADFPATFRVFAYAQAVAPLNIIPVIGPMVAGIWSLVIMVLGCIVVHKGREERTEGMIVLGVLMFPLAAFILLTLLFSSTLRVGL